MQLAQSTTLRERIEQLARDYPDLSPSRLRRKAKAMAQPVDCLTAAQRAVRDAEERRAREHMERVVLPRRAETRPQIERLFAERAIDQAQRNAAERLQRDWQGSGFQSRLVADYEGHVGSGTRMPGMGPTSSAYTAAMRALGIRYSGLIVATVIENQAVPSWAAEKGVQPEFALEMFREALDCLCFFYGYKKDYSPTRG